LDYEDRRAESPDFVVDAGVFGSKFYGDPPRGIIIALGGSPIFGK